MSYSKTDDVIIENAPRLEGTRTFTTAANLAKYENWAFELNFPIKYKKLIDGYGGNQFIYNAYDAEYLDTRFNRSRWNWLAYWQINVNLPAEFKVEIGGWYMTKFLEEFFDIGSMGGLNFGVAKTFASFTSINCFGARFTPLARCWACSFSSMCWNIICTSARAFERPCSGVLCC